jgi:branched-subunit amino acid transport protein
LIIVSLVAASLSGEPLQTWLAALAALLVAVLTNHVVVTMGIGVLVFAFLSLFGF